MRASLGSPNLWNTATCPLASYTVSSLGHVAIRAHKVSLYFSEKLSTVKNRTAHNRFFNLDFANAVWIDGQNVL